MNTRNRRSSRRGMIGPEQTTSGPMTNEMQRHDYMEYQQHELEKKRTSKMTERQVAYLMKLCLMGRPCAGQTGADVSSLIKRL